MLQGDHIREILSFISYMNDDYSSIPYIIRNMLSDDNQLIDEADKIEYKIKNKENVEKNIKFIARYLRDILRNINNDNFINPAQ